MMQAEPSISMSQAFIIGILSIGASALTNYLVGVRSAAKFEGAANERFENIESDVEELKRSKNDQWTAINKTNVEVATAKADIRNLQYRAKTHG